MVDAHVHAWPSTLRHPAQRRTKHLPSTEEDLLQVLTTALIDDAILVQPSIVSNESITIEAAQKSPRLHPIVQAQLAANDGVARLESAAARGAIGVRLHLAAQGLPDAEDRDALWRVLACAARLRLVVEWLVRPRDAWIIRAAGDKHPGLIQVLDHLGFPDDFASKTQRHAVAEVASTAGTFTKLAAIDTFSNRPFPHTDTWPWVEAVKAAFGPDRMMWGSNWPLTTEELPYAKVLSLPGLLPFITEEEHARILGGVATRVWPSLGGGSFDQAPE